MAFTPHTAADRADMLAAIGVSDIENLFAEIPTHLRAKGLTAVPEALSEMQLQQLMQSRAAQNTSVLNFAGAGAYEHYIPAAVWDITARGEFMTAYTPYQAEASQGTLQLLYEYQTMMSSLMGLAVSNASMYDGATALAEAVLMAGRLSKHKEIHVAVLGTVHPHYVATLKSIVTAQDIHIHTLDFDQKTGTVNVDVLNALVNQTVLSALVIAQPNYFGVLENVDALTNAAHQHNIKVIANVNPTVTALLKEPGQWGEKGADIACGEGQPLGVPLASGGPYFGFLCCRMEIVRQMPGRIIGRTVDKQGRMGFALTLQAREQHIRRGKATSNICTNQGLLVTAATIYMSLLGPVGLRRVAEHCHHNTCLFVEQIKNDSNIELAFSGKYFHEVVLRLKNKSAKNVIEKLLAKGFHAGVALDTFLNMSNALLVCVTETKTPEDIMHFAKALREELAS